MTARMPLVSVILSAYNDEMYVKQSINSILQQDYSNFELLVADDGSKDSTKSIIDEIIDPRIVRFYNADNIGLIHTWNKLINIAKGEYLIFQDADDISHRSRISKLLFFLENNPEYALCGSNYVRFHKTWGLYITSNFPTSYIEIVNSLNNRIIPFFGKVMYRRKVFDKHGGFREYFKGFGWEDFDLILRVSETDKIANISDLVYEYRYRSDSSSKMILDSPIERLFIDKIGFFLREQRLVNGFDSIQKNDIESINEFIHLCCNSYKKDQLIMIRYNRILSSMISNRDFLSAWKFWVKNLRSNTSFLVTCKTPIRIILSIIKTFLKYLKFWFLGKLKYSIDEFY